MNSEQEDNAEHPDEQNVKPDVVKEDNSPEKKNNRLNEHAKPKRRRRGKKRKHRKESAATCESANHDQCESVVHAECEHGNHAECESPSWDSVEDLSCDIDAFNDIIIRPVNVPKAPENSTQFIMDDHNECRLYMSFETPNPYLADPSNLEGENGVIFEPVGEDAAYRDIDYEYESPGDFDNSAYYDREFELSYKSNRFDELMRLSRPELISAMQKLETRSKELSDELVKQNPSPVLEKLQAELLELQERNSYLRECNSELTTLVLKNETEHSVNDLSLEESSENVSTSLEESMLHGGDTDKDEVSCEDPEECSEPMSEMVVEKPVCDTGLDDSEDMCIAQSTYEESVVDAGQSDKLQSMLSDAEREPVQSSTTDSCELISDKEETGCIKSNCHEDHTHCEMSRNRVREVHDEVTAVNNKSVDVFHVAKQTKCSSELSFDEEPPPSETSVV